VDPNQDGDVVEIRSAVGCVDNEIQTVFRHVCRGNERARLGARGRKLGAVETGRERGTAASQNENTDSNREKQTHVPDQADTGLDSSHRSLVA
jgi:hypothetical protein